MIKPPDASTPYPSETTPPLPSFTAPTDLEGAPAGMFIRTLATIIDGILVGIVSLPLVLAVKLATQGVPADSLGSQISIQIVSNLAVTVTSLAYFSYYYEKKGASPGKMLFAIRVVDDTSGQFIHPLRTLKRELIGKTLFTLLMLFFGAPVFAAALRKDKRCLHDFLSNTRVIYSRKPTAPANLSER